MTSLNYIVDQTLFDNQLNVSLSLYAHLTVTLHTARASEKRWLERFQALYTAIRNIDTPHADVKESLVINWLYASLDLAEVYTDKKDKGQLEAVQNHWLVVFKQYADTLIKQNQKEEDQ